MPRRRATKPRRRFPPILSVREAAELIIMTPGGVYAAIKRGDLAGKRVDGRWQVARADAREYLRKRIEFYRKTDPNRPLTDEEFMQQLWDSDPD
jgi:hypothetical protein